MKKFQYFHVENCFKRSKPKYHKGLIQEKKKWTVIYDDETHKTHKSLTTGTQLSKL